MRVVLGVSGASGAALAMNCAAALCRLGAAVDLVLSALAERTLAEEVGRDAVDRLRAMAARLHPWRDLGAGIASGASPVAGMIVAPCSMRSLAAIAHGLDDNLLTRAAGVQLKERRPLTLAHLRNIQAAAEMGAVILPPFRLLPATGKPCRHHRPDRGPRRRPAASGPAAGAGLDP